MSVRDKKLESLGFPLDRIKYAPGTGMIEPLSVDGNTMYLSGQVPYDGDELKYVGKVPSKVGKEDATRAAALCGANLLRTARKYLGTLDKIERVVRITGYVNADPDFTECHLIVNGASTVIREVLGGAGRHARTAVGMGQLPLGVCVEVEMILKIKG